jgi:hypothetical protein
MECLHCETTLLFDKYLTVVDGILGYVCHPCEMEALDV